MNEIQNDNQEQRIPEHAHEPMPMTQHTMRMGLIIGACMAADFICSSSDGWAKFFSFFLEAYILIQTFRMAKLYRDYELDGRWSFKTAFKYVFMLFFFGALIAAFVRFIYLQYINVDLMDNLYNQVMLTMEQLKMNIPEESEKLLEDMFRPSRYTLYGIFGDCFIGALLGLLFAPFLSRRRDI